MLFPPFLAASEIACQVCIPLYSITKLMSSPGRVACTPLPTSNDAREMRWQALCFSSMYVTVILCGACGRSGRERNGKWRPPSSSCHEAGIQYLWTPDHHPTSDPLELTLFIKCHIVCRFLTTAQAGMYEVLPARLPQHRTQLLSRIPLKGRPRPPPNLTWTKRCVIPSL